MAIGISVIICTYNSAARIRETLRHLASQDTNRKFLWEVNLVDNASTDDTSYIAFQLWKSLDINIPLHIYNEPRPGKSFALDTGINNAKYDFVIVCDDDNWLHPEYITNAFKIISKNKKIGILGGQSIAVVSGELPEWFDEFKDRYAIGKQFEKSGDISPKMFIWGAGMVFRRKLYKRVYLNLPPILSGPKLNNRFPGEDVEFCMRIIMYGYQLFYDESLKFSHYIPSNRLSISYRDILTKNYDFETYVINLYKRQIKAIKSNLATLIKLFCSSFLRYLFCILFSSKKWDQDFEAETIYQISGIKLKQLKKEVLLVKALQKDLAGQ